MISKLHRYFLLGVLLFCLSFSVLGQDIHYSQFFNSPLNMNPALTGIFNGDVRYAANYRNQWSSVPVPYMTFTGSWDQKFYPKKGDAGFWSGGVLFNYDRAGDSRLRLVQLGLSGSYTYLLTPQNLITGGLQLGGAQRAFTNGSNLQWENQFDGRQFDPTLSSGENFDRTSLFFADISAGLNYRWQKSPRTKIDLGGAAYHVNSPKQSFYKEDIKLPLRYALQLITSFKLSDLFDFQLHGTGQFQGTAKELVPGAAFKIYVNQKRGKEFALTLGALARYSDYFDAVTPMIAFDYQQWYVGLSYDINISELQVATNRRGGPEISVMYKITNVKPLSEFKVCPIF